jgi:two-component system response regulator HydG
VDPIVLVVDDEEANRLTLERILVREGVEVHHAEDGIEALERIRERRPALVLSDLKMPRMDGMELLRAALEVDPELEFVLMTAYGTVETAVEAMKDGAYDFITKPLRRADIVRTVRKALERRALLSENRSLRDQLTLARSEDFIGHSASIRRVLDEASQVADSMASVLITGESGTGKGMLARYIHRHSPRQRAPLITVNLGALPPTLLESELFGYESGAFTGAKGRKQGRFDMARRGTIFLDEITEMDITLQAKLLRVLQDGEYERLGGSKTIHADTRVIAASNRDPATAVQEGQLRQDLLYRLDVIRLHLPPLRERPDDIPLLAQHFILEQSQRHSREVQGLAPEALDALQAWHWPGNVRELQNALERAVVLSRGERISVQDLPPAVAQQSEAPAQLLFEVGTPLRDMERRMIEATLKRVQGDKARAARLLGTTTRTLYRREAEWRSRH